MAQMMQDTVAWTEKQKSLRITDYGHRWLNPKEVCNGGVACSLLKLGILEKTVTDSLFHSGLHSSSPFFVEKTTLQELLPT